MPQNTEGLSSFFNLITLKKKVYMHMVCMCIPLLAESNANIFIIKLLKITFVSLGDKNISDKSSHLCKAHIITL